MNAGDGCSSSGTLTAKLSAVFHFEYVSSFNLQADGMQAHTGGQRDTSCISCNITAWE